MPRSAGTEPDPARAQESPLVPPDGNIDAVREAAAGCTACELYATATQTVFGEGRPEADLMLVGEQPGDQEDLQGRPFVGPAGGVLDRALTDAGIDRDRVFVTNVVKHFRWRPSGKRRLHEKPNARQVRACRPWFEAELGLVQPDVLVLMGATAAQAVLGPAFRVSTQRGVFVASDAAPRVIATIHPSAILRSRDADEREAAYASFVADLKTAASAVGDRSNRARRAKSSAA
jgi:DNA polymerase